MLKHVCLAAFVALALICHGIPVQATPPQRPMRIAYLENGPFWLFLGTYEAFQEALKQHADVTAIYPEDLHRSPGWNTSAAEMEREARDIFAAKPDLILAAGTGAARALLKVNDGKTPILGIAISDPIAAGVMTSATEAVAPNFFCEVIPDRWKNMYRVFHDVVGFKKMGMLYPAGENGRVYAGVDDARQVAEESGFTVLDVLIPDESPMSCARGITQLHQMGADAFFIGPLNCFWFPQDLEPLLKQIHAYEMPTFARDGSVLVQHGAMMGFATWDFSPSGMRLANAAVKVFKGAPPSSLSLVSVLEPIIALNLGTIRELGLNLPFDVLLVADEVYEQ